MNLFLPQSSPAFRPGSMSDRLRRRDDSAMTQVWKIRKGVGGAADANLCGRCLVEETSPALVARRSIGQPGRSGRKAYMG